MKKKKQKLTKRERQAIKEILAEKDFDAALNKTPESILESLFELCGGPEGAHDFFDSDMLPNGVPKPLDPEAEAELDARAVRAYQRWKTKKAATRRGRTVKDKAKRLA